MRTSCLLIKSKVTIHPLWRRGKFLSGSIGKTDQI